MRVTSPFDVVILAGGAGTRLWPASEGARSKHLLRLVRGKTLIEATFQRALKLTGMKDRIWCVTVKSQVSEIRKAVPSLLPSRIIAEPWGKNSGPAACLAALEIERVRGEPTTLLLWPADHFIPPVPAFFRSMRIGVGRADAGKSLVTFGLKIRQPRPDFGYVEALGSLHNGVRKVRRFVEKPSEGVARRFMRSGRHYWNSGMFAWRTDRFLEEMKACSPGIGKTLSAAFRSGKPSVSALRTAYRMVRNLSIDYALLEKSQTVEVVPSRFEWSDVGTWASVYEGFRKENAILGRGRVVGGKRNLIYSEETPVAIFGVDDLVVVAANGKVMVTTRSASLELKSYLERARSFRSA